MVCVNANVSNPKFANVVPTLPGATRSWLPTAAAAGLDTVNCKNPLITVAVTLGTCVLIASASPLTFWFGATGTATSMLLILIVFPAVNAGLAMVLVIVPYILL